MSDFQNPLASPFHAMHDEAGHQEEIHLLKKLAAAKTSSPSGPLMAAVTNGETERIKTTAPVPVSRSARVSIDCHELMPRRRKSVMILFSLLICAQSPWQPHRRCYDAVQTATGWAALSKIIFWNVNGKNLTSLVCDMARDTGAHAIVLNEWTANSRDVLKELASKVDKNFRMPPFIAPEGRFQCFCREQSLDLSEVHKAKRISVRKLNIGSTKALLGLVHSVDMRNYDDATRQSVAQSLAEEFRWVGSTQGHNRFIMMGDFNMNPFDRGMNLAAGWNAMMTRACVKNGQRTFQESEYDFYYNPMWGLFGDLSPGPPGTIYDTSNQGPYGWSMLDQVLISHALVTQFSDVQIITKAGSVSLVDSNGRPDQAMASDHLPIVAVLKGDTDE